MMVQGTRPHKDRSGTHRPPNALFLKPLPCPAECTWYSKQIAVSSACLSCIGRVPCECVPWERTLCECILCERAWYIRMTNKKAYSSFSSRQLLMLPHHTKSKYTKVHRKYTKVHKSTQKYTKRLCNIIFMFNCSYL